MSTDEQDQCIGRAFLQRREAQRKLQCLRFKAREMGKALAPISAMLPAALGNPDDITEAQLAAYPSGKEVAAVIHEMQQLQAEIKQLDELLDGIK